LPLKTWIEQKDRGRKICPFDFLPADLNWDINFFLFLDWKLHHWFQQLASILELNCNYNSDFHGSLISRALDFPASMSIFVSYRTLTNVLGMNDFSDIEYLQSSAQREQIDVVAEKRNLWW
jgi:hypothetical protein